MGQGDFKELLGYFPMVELPFTLQEGSEHEFGLNSDPIPIRLLEDWIYPHLPFQADEFTEVIPGVHWKSSEGCSLLVFWTARLMKYSFVVYCFDPNMRYTDLAEVAGFTAFGDEVIRRMARIDDPDTIYVVEGSQKINDKDIRPGHTRKWEIQILSNGELEELEMTD
ncbi:MAG: hypothetical protein IPM48_06330 [Saprospiraceae bacterium]|nr:hypothetical protein [Saprospiraceae bacterium]